MIKSYQYLDIDINKKIYKRLRAVQGDSKSRYILVSLYDNSKVYNLSNCSVKVFGCKSDKKIFFNYAIVTDVINGKFEIELTNQALAVAGELEIQILILGTNQERLTSFSFYIDVEKSIVNDGVIESANEFKALTGALSQVEEWNGYFEETSGKIEEKYTERLNNVDSQLEQNTNEIKYITNNITYIGHFPRLNGEIDDTQRLQRAINHAQSNGGILELGSEVYNISDTLIIENGIKIRSNHNHGTTGLGSYYGTEIKYKGNETAIKIFRSENELVYGFVMENVRISRYSSDYNPKIAIDFRGSEFFFREIRINGGFDVGLKINGSIGVVEDSNFCVCNHGVHLDSVASLSLIHI